MRWGVRGCPKDDGEVVGFEKGSLAHNSPFTVSKGWEGILFTKRVAKRCPMASSASFPWSSPVSGPAS